MSKRTLYLAAFAGTLVAAGVWCWPEGPLWQSGPGAGRNCGFSPDGRLLVTSSFFDNHTQVCRWDSRTGRLFSRTEMACDPPLGESVMRTVWPSADGSLALVGQGTQNKEFPNSLTFGTGNWFLHDAATGRRILGPIEGANHVMANPFSSEGRWFAAYQGDPRSGVWSWNQLAIYSSATGKRVIALAVESDRAAYCRFAPDGNSAAVSWEPDSKDAAQQSIIVQIVELPSARQRRRVEFAPNSWFRVDRWDGRYLTTVAKTKERDKSSPMFHQIVYDLEQNAIGNGIADPMLRDYVDESGKTVRFATDSSSEWVAHFSHVGPGVSRPGLTGWLDGFAMRLGLLRDITKGMRADVRMIDYATGKTLHKLPRPVPLSLRFSDDGKLLACGEDSIEVWDTDPPPRWPKAIAWGIIATGVVVVLGRWRRGRGQPRSA